MNMTDKKSSTMLSLALGGFLGCVMLASPAYGQETPVPPTEVLAPGDECAGTTGATASDAVAATAVSDCGTPVAPTDGTVVTYLGEPTVVGPGDDGYVAGEPAESTLTITSAAQEVTIGGEMVDIPVGAVLEVSEGDEGYRVLADTPNVADVNGDGSITAEDIVPEGTLIPRKYPTVAAPTTTFQDVTPTKAAVSEVTTIPNPVGDDSVAQGKDSFVKGESSVAIGEGAKVRALGEVDEVTIPGEPAESTLTITSAAQEIDIGGEMVDLPVGTVLEVSEGDDGYTVLADTPNVADVNGDGSITAADIVPEGTLIPRKYPTAAAPTTTFQDVTPTKDAVDPITTRTQEVIAVDNAVAVGANAEVTGNNGIAIGAGAEAGADEIAIGADGVDYDSVTVGGIDLVDARADIDTNTANIGTNTANIATNTADIAANVMDIATNAEGVAANAGGISTNAADIGTNAGNIATNTGNIANNSDDIDTNRSGVAMAVALAHLPLVNGEKGGWGIAAGSFDGESAVAIGVNFSVSDNASFKIGTASSGGETSFGIGFGMGF